MFLNKLFGSSPQYGQWRHEVILMAVSLITKNLIYFSSLVSLFSLFLIIIQTKITYWKQNLFNFLQWFIFIFSHSCQTDLVLLIVWRFVFLETLQLRSFYCYYYKFRGAFCTRRQKTCGGDSLKEKKILHFGNNLRNFNFLNLKSLTILTFEKFSLFLENLSWI